MEIFNNRFVSKALGLVLISFSILFFIHSLNNRIKNSVTDNQDKTIKEMRISADKEKGELYLWGGEEGMLLRASAPITYRYDSGFYIISIDDVDKPYILEVYERGKLITKFRYFAGEKYPVYSDR